ncbi:MULTISPECIES: hypothetical protein [unclassified Providencia]|uniref:hypothetical protein n=1 Tax=unclassified Providencia TaxID=2633465 RepID=UPI00234B820E|nr:MULTISPECIES: hypothetical protein [unclassified Providencia]
MKERGIIFNSEMVRAILDGRKTQTRRIVKHQRHPSQEIKLCDDGFFHWSMIGAEKPLSAINYEYGRVGDRLWVRETYSLLGNEDACPIDWNDNIVNDKTEAARIYRASCAQKSGDYGLWSIPDDADWKPHTEEMKFEGSWTPSIHMPRWASRITLEITDVRVERLNNISPRDVVAEGLIKLPATGRYVRFQGAQHFGLAYDSHKDAFADLWDEVSKPDCNYESNPWVWVIEFKRV